MSLPKTRYLAVKPLPPEESPFLHTCEEGHAWTEQPDGTVSPSWGFAGTHARFPGHDPATCPEPQRDEQGRYECPGCDGRFWSAHGDPRMMGDPWNYEEGCAVPPPACRKPAITTSRWMLVKVKSPWASHPYPKWTHDWVPLDGSGAPDITHVNAPTLF